MNKYPAHYEGSPEQAFGLAPARPETLMERAVERIIHSDVVGACYTELRSNYGSSIKNWLPRLGQNDYDWLKAKSNINFDQIEAKGLTFGFSKPCYCHRSHCKRFFAYDRKPDPVLDLGRKNKNQMITNDPRILNCFQTDQQFMNKQLKRDLEDETNPTYSFVDESAKEDREEQYEHRSG